MTLKRMWKVVIQNGNCLAETPEVLGSWAEVKEAISRIEAGLGWEAGVWKKVNPDCAVKRWPGMPDRLIVVWVYLAPEPKSPKPKRRKEAPAQPQVN